jgi:hypothetical protein
VALHGRTEENDENPESGVPTSEVGRSAKVQPTRAHGLLMPLHNADRVPALIACPYFIHD